MGSSELFGFSGPVAKKPGAQQAQPSQEQLQKANSRVAEQAQANLDVAIVVVTRFRQTEEGQTLFSNPGLRTFAENANNFAIAVSLSGSLAGQALSDQELLSSKAGLHLQSQVTDLNHGAEHVVTLTRRAVSLAADFNEARSEEVQIILGNMTDALNASRNAPNNFERQRRLDEAKPQMEKGLLLSDSLDQDIGGNHASSFINEADDRTDHKMRREILSMALAAGFSAAAFLAAKEWKMTDFIYGDPSNRQQFGNVVRDLAQRSLYERTIGRTSGNLTPTEKAERVAADDAYAKLKTLIGATAAAELRQRIKAAAKTQADASKQIDEIIAKVVAENQKAISNRKMA